MPTRSITSADIKALIERLWASAAYLELDIRNGRRNADSSEDIAFNVAADIQHCVIEPWASKFYPEFSGAPLFEAGRFTPADDIEFGVDRLEDMAEASADDLKLLGALRQEDIDEAFREKRQIVLYFSGTELAQVLRCPPASYAKADEAERLLERSDRQLLDLWGIAEGDKLRLIPLAHGSEKPNCRTVLVAWLSVPLGQAACTSDIEDGLNEVLHSAEDVSLEALVH